MSNGDAGAADADHVVDADAAQTLHGDVVEDVLTRSDSGASDALHADVEHLDAAVGASPDTGVVADIAVTDATESADADAAQGPCSADIVATDGQLLDLGSADVGWTDGAGGTDSAAPQDVAATPAPLPEGATTAEGLGSNAWGLQSIEPPSLPAAAFQDVSKQFKSLWGVTLGLCLAAADLDGNGREDLVMIRLKGTKATIVSVLFGPKGHWVVESKFDTTQLYPSWSCRLADLNDDGFPDLLVGAAAGAALYIADGKGAFSDQSSKWLPFLMDFEAWSVTTADLDGDGDLDIFVGAGGPPNFGMGSCGGLLCWYSKTDMHCKWPKEPPALQSQQDRVLIRGAKLPMQDATKKWKVPPGGIQTQVEAVDVNNDGKMDLLVGDDFGDHRLLLNTGGTFVTHDLDIGLHAFAAAMGWGVGDFNDDGRLDATLADIGPQPVFIQKPPTPSAPPSFADKGGALGVWGPTWGTNAWSPVVADFNNDGRDDVVYASTFNAPKPTFEKLAQGCSTPSPLDFAKFTSIAVMLLSQPGTHARKAYKLVDFVMPSLEPVSQVPIDFDADGDLDLVQVRAMNDHTFYARFLRNDISGATNFARVVVTGKKGNMGAVGAVVSGVAGKRLRTRWLGAAGGYGGLPYRRAHFGLGSATKLTAVKVRWPDGTQTDVGDVKAGTTKAVTWP